jgi:alanine racemase
MTICPTDMSNRRIDERLVTGRLTIDLDALKRNWRLMAGKAPKASTGAAIKANCYGLGNERGASALYRAGCRHFFVANCAEGILIRQFVAESEIFVFGGLTPVNAPFYHESALTPVLNSLQDIAIWAEWTRKAGSRRPCALHIDTGMNRLGISREEVRSYFGDQKNRIGITPVLVLSHLACADSPDNPMNRIQLERFREATAFFPETRLSLANSGGVLLGADYHFDITRPGIALYGGEAVNQSISPVEPVVTLEGRILQVKQVKNGETLGYGGAATLERDSVIAIAGLGYGDGISRSASGHGIAMRQICKGAQGWIDGYRAPIIGRISMDVTALDVTDIPGEVLEKAQWVEFFGRNIKLDDFARAAGTIGYEVLTGIGQRVARLYIEQEA